jgi:HEAT repeat protein
MLAIVYQQASIGQDKPAALTESTPAKTEIDAQLKVFKEALLKGSIDAATVMLFLEDPKAREFLLETLRQSENSPARMAVCNALIQARISKKTVKNNQDFIEPLLGVLAAKTDTEAHLAAEATLIFEYENIGESLAKIAADASKPVETRLNAIYALKLRLDMMATIKLIELVDNPEKQVASEAEKALHSLDIPVGKDPETRKQNIHNIKERGQEAFLRTQLSRQGEQMRQMRDELTRWRDSYLAALDKIYDTITEDAAKSKFLAEHLGNSEAVVRLWALDKVYKWRLVASGTSKLPPELGPILIRLISDQGKDVRLKAAEVLALMPELNSARPLLAQLEAEQSDQVKMELFVALGGACSFALRPHSEVDISPEIRQIRKQTLEWAEKFLSEEDAEKVRNGADVIKKLLAPNGLKPEEKEVDKYLGLLSKRYNQQKDKPDGALRGELLSAMAGLCAQDSACKAKAAKLFEPLFKEALRDKTDLIRETAVEGLIYIDKTSALKILRKDFVNDPSIILRKMLITLANEVGGKEDLVWLAEKIGSNSESEPAWQAMLNIFENSDASVLNEWVGKLTSQGSQIKLSDEQKIAFLKIAEKVAKTPEEKRKILTGLLDVYLRGSKVEDAVKLVTNCLSEEDLDSNNAVVRSIDNYLSKPPAGADPNAVFQALISIKPPQPRPKWQQWLKTRAARLGKAKEPDKPSNKSE